MAEENKPDPKPAADEAAKPEAEEEQPIELLPDPTAKPKPEAKPEGDDKKPENALAYQLRKEKERANQLEQDNKKYKQREEEERQAKLTAEQKRDEELVSIREERDRLRRENLITAIGIDAKLPKSMWPRIQGADEDAMRADAAELAALVKRAPVGGATDPVRDSPGKGRIYKRSELRADAKLARSPEVAQAAREGRITND